MQKIPQIVNERLRAGAVVGGHPDANVLTAFAERSLPEQERGGVLAHLSACGDCRDIVALALPATESIEAAPAAVRWSWFTWPAFRWGFAAAGVALIVLGAVEFERRQPTHSDTVATQVAPVPAGAALHDQGSSQTASSTLPAAAPRAPLSANEKLAKKDARTLAQEKLAAPRPIESNGRNIAGLQALAAAPATKQALVNAPSPPQVSETVEVQAQNEVVQTETASAATATNTSADQSLSYNTAPLSRAKPADVQAMQGQATDALSARVRWSITAVGGLQRSLDQGKTWQDVDVNVNGGDGGTLGGVVGVLSKAEAKQNSMHAAAVKAIAEPIFFRTVAAAGNEVWAGGTNAALFHSIDGGNHWTRVLPSFSGAVLTGDVSSVEFPDPQHGTVTTSTPEIWVTSDGGQSWKKQ